MNSDRSLSQDEWNSSDIAFINDLVAVGGHLSSITADSKMGLFGGDRVVYAFRPSGDGSIRKLCKFKNIVRNSLN